MWVSVWRAVEQHLLGAISASLIAVLAIQTGCGPGAKSGPSGLVPVTGKITLDEQPLAGAQVIFIPINSPTGESFDAGAITNDQGIYELRSGEGKGVGAMPGEYRVVVSRLVMADGSAVKPDKDKSPMQLVLEGAKETVPATYSDMAFSSLKATVPPGGGTFDFPLTSKPAGKK